MRKYKSFMESNQTIRSAAIKCNHVRFTSIFSVFLPCFCSVFRGRGLSSLTVQRIYIYIYKCKMLSVTLSFSREREISFPSLLILLCRDQPILFMQLKYLLAYDIFSKVQFARLGIREAFCLPCAKKKKSSVREQELPTLI